MREQQAAQAQPTAFVVKIGDEKQEKSGLTPPPLTEEELIKLFKKPNNKKKGKK